MVQNHLLQVLSLIAMEPPIAFTAESVRDRKMEALLAVQPLCRPTVTRRRTSTSCAASTRRLGERRRGAGYREEKGVDPESTTETYAAVQLYLDNWRWAGVPFYLAHRQAAAEADHRDRHSVPQAAARDLPASRPDSVSANLLIVNVQPDEGISLRFETKLPGARMQIAPVMMSFRYGTTFGGEVPEAYETLLLDAMLGDPTLFARHDFVEASWALINPVLDAWRAQTGDIPTVRGR